MDIHHLKIFAAVYKHRSFSRASEELYISQPTISEHIKNLEQELNCKLFDRLGRTIIPTPQAELILPKALQLVTEIAAIPHLLMEAGSAICGHIVIGASTIPGTYLLPPLAARFKKEHPEVSFEILIQDSASTTTMVASHDILMGVVGAMTNTKQLHIQPFYDDELVCAGIPILADQYRHSNLPTAPFLQREQGSGTRTVMEKLLKERGLDPASLEIVATLGSTAAIKEAMKAGLGISILSRMAILDELATGRLKEIRLGAQTMSRSFYLLTHKQRSLPPHYHAFYEMVREVFSHGSKRDEKKTV